MSADVTEIAPGLWLWRSSHPGWTADAGWDAAVSSTCAVSRGEVVLIDPLAPGPAAGGVWRRLDAAPPTIVLILKPDHVRDVDLFVRRYGAEAFGPSLVWPNDVPRTALVPVEPGTEIPGGLRAVYDGRGRNETPVWIPDHRTLVFADALTAPAGELVVWATPWHRERALPALRALLDLPFERVIVSHGAPVHDRGAYERALEREPWEG